ncbi:MAG: translocation/assembly module TamB domain-containing protein [Betaproteobacteria bacterium]
MAVRVLTRRNLMALCLLAAVGLLAAAASSYLLFLIKKPDIAPLRWAVERTLERQTGLRVSLGRLRPAPFGVLVVDGLEAREQSGRTLLAADQVAIRLSLWSWAAQRGRLSALVSRVELVRPRLQVSRGADGTWNLSRYLRPTETGEGWQGELLIREGEVTVQGWHPSLLANPGGGLKEAEGSGFRWTAVNGTVSAGPKGTRVKLDGRTDLWPDSRISVTARLGGTAPSRAELALTGIELARVQQFLPGADRFGEFRKGRGDLRVSLLLERAKPRLASAEVVVHGAEWRHPAIEGAFSEVVGRLTLQGETVRLSDLSFVFMETRWTAQGRVTGLSDPELDVRLSGENASLRALTKALPVSLKGVALDGRATLDLTARGEWRAPLVSGFLRLNGVSVAVPGGNLPISDLNGTVEFAGDGLRTNRLTARIAGGQVSVRGEVRDWRQPHGSLRLDLEGVPSEEVRSLAPTKVAAQLQPLVGGRVSGTLELEGVLAHPAVRGKLALLGAEWGDLPLESVQAEGAYAKGRLNLKRLAAVAAGGRLEASATLSGLGAGEMSYAFSGRASQFDAAVLARVAGLSLPMAVEGRVSALIAGTGEGLAWDKLSVMGTLAVSEGQVGEERLTSAEAGFTINRGEVSVDYFTASLASGRLSGYGRRTADGRLSGTISGQGLKLATVARHVQGLPLDGTADVLAELGGRADQPELSGEFTLSSLSFREQDFTDGRGRFRLTPQQFLLEELAVHRDGGMLRASGTVGLRSDYLLNLSLAVEALPAKTVLGLAGVEVDLTGTANGTFTLRGPARTALVTGQVALASGKVAGFPYTAAAAQFAYSGGVLEFERLEAEGEGVTVAGQGRLVGGELDLRVAADHLDLGRLPLPGREEGAWRGTGSFRGILRGHLRHLALEGEVTGTGVAYRGYAVDSLAGTLRYQDGKLTLQKIEVERGRGRYFVTGDLEPREARLDLRFRLDQADLEDLLSLATIRLPYRIAGQATGVLHVWGGVRNPSARLLAETEEVSLEGLRLAGDVDLSLKDGEVTINRLRLGEVEGEGLLVALGRIGRSLDMEARLHRMNIQQLMTLLGRKDSRSTEVAGRVDADLVLKGTADDPRVSLAVAVGEARVNGMALNDVRGRVAYADGAINLEEVVVASGERRLTASGTWPVPAARLAALGVKAPERAWDLRVEMAQGDMGVLSFILPGLHLSGPGSLSVRVTGPAEAPQVAGEVVADGVTVNHPALGGEIHGLRGRIELAPGVVRATRLTGFYGEGEAQLSGQVTLAGLSVQELDLALSGRDVHYRSAPFEAWLDADLTVRGPLAQAVVGGRAVLRRSTLTLGVKADPRKITWDPKLDLTVTSQEDMRVMTVDRNVDVRAYGTLALRGSLSRPAFTGEAEASRGTIVYLNTPFQVTRGQAVFAAYRGILPTLDVTAETVVSPSQAAPEANPAEAEQLKIRLQVTGPTENLALNLSSDPPLSQAEILAALGLPGDVNRILGGGQGNGKQSELFRLAEQQLSQRLFAGIEVAVADALQLDQFSLAPRFQEKNLQLHLGKYLVENVYLTYTRTMEVDPWESIGLEYRILPGLTFTTSYDNRGEMKLGLEARHRF